MALIQLRNRDANVQTYYHLLLMLLLSDWLVGFSTGAGVASMAGSAASAIAVGERGTGDDGAEGIDGPSTSLDLDLGVAFVVVFACFIAPTLIGSFPGRCCLGW